MSTINQPPRLQLGDAPLKGYAGSSQDQFALVWQTTGSLTDDQFIVEYRPQDSNNWLDAPSPAIINTGVDSRINHTVTIPGLDYDADYEYRVRHFQGNTLVANFQEDFQTRLEPGDASEFTFATYGDSAGPRSKNYPTRPEDFAKVHARINTLDPDFGLLLGDNAYSVGSHEQYDYRFDPFLAPEAVEWTSGHIDFSAVGNHDTKTEGGRPYLESYEFPIPVAGVNSSVAPLSGTPEFNYAFDYGNTHFVTFDSNNLENDLELDQLLKYVEEDLAASDAQWKIVFAHHPVAGVPDKDPQPGDNYYQQVVPRLKDAGADLFLTGHSHTYSWTYPLTGFSGNDATFVKDTDKVYDKGVGLVQAVIGTGGTNLRDGDYDRFPFVASGYSQSTSRPSEHGFAHVSVSDRAITVDYVAADDGEIIDSFKIVDSDAPEPTVYVSTTNSGTVDGISFRDEDILAYDPLTGTWSLHFDGSDLGLSGTDVNAFHIDDDGSILLSFKDDATDPDAILPDVGVVDDSDIVRFIPTSTGSNTFGTFQLYFDGSDVGLDTEDEDIDAIARTPEGRLVIGTTGNPSVPGLSSPNPRDEDLLVFDDTSLGETTSGTWDFYFDGSDEQLNTNSDEDIYGSWIDPNGEIYLTTKGSFEVSGLSGNGADIFACNDPTTGVNTSCSGFSPFFDGSANGLAGETIDGFSLV